MGLRCVALLLEVTTSSGRDIGELGSVQMSRTMGVSARATYSEHDDFANESEVGELRGCKWEDTGTSRHRTRPTTTCEALKTQDQHCEPRTSYDDDLPRYRISSPPAFSSSNWTWTGMSASMDDEGGRHGTSAEDATPPRRC